MPPRPREVVNRGRAPALHAPLIPIARRVKRERLTPLCIPKLRSLEHLDAGRAFRGYDLSGMITPAHLVLRRREAG